MGLGKFHLGYLFFAFFLATGFYPAQPSKADPHLPGSQSHQVNLTEEEKAFLLSHPIIRLGTDETWRPYVINNLSGELEGLDIDFIRYINQTTGANIRLVTGQWSDMIEKAKRLEIDGLSTSSPLESRKSHFLFSKPYINDFPILVIPAKSQLHITSLKELSGKRVAIQKGNEFFLSILKSYPGITIVQAASEREAIKLMVEGKADFGFSSTSTYVGHQNHFFDLIKIGYVVTDHQLNVVYSIRKDWPELVSIIDKCLFAMPEDVHHKIYRKWFQLDPHTFPNSMDENDLQLTPAEKEWLDGHPVIRVANENDRPPFDFNENGIAKGFSIDYIVLVAQKAGLKLDFVNGNSWTELIERFKQKKIDVMPAFYVNEARKAFTRYTAPYYRGKLGIFTNSDVTRWDYSLLNKRVGMESSHGSIPFIKEKIPGIQIIEVDWKDELVKKLATNQLDAIIGNPFVFYYLSKENQLENIQLSDFINMTDEEQRKNSLHIGVRADLPLLHSIINKAMDSISPAEMDKILNKWADVTFLKQTNWKLVSQIGGLIASIILFLIWHNKVLKSKVRQKTKELKEFNTNLEAIVIERTKELSEVNAQLKNSLQEVKKLSGFLPICASCKKIRDDKGYWNQIEEYITTHSEAQFSHSICHECAKKIYPELVHGKDQFSG